MLWRGCLHRYREQNSLNENNVYCNLWGKLLELVQILTLSLWDMLPSNWFSPTLQNPQHARRARGICNSPCGLHASQWIVEEKEKTCSVMPLILIMYQGKHHFKLTRTVEGFGNWHPVMYSTFMAKWGYHRSWSRCLHRQACFPKFMRASFSPHVLKDWSCSMHAEMEPACPCGWWLGMELKSVRPMHPSHQY